MDEEEDSVWRPSMYVLRDREGWLTASSVKNRAEQYIVGSYSGNVWQELLSHGVGMQLQICESYLHTSYPVDVPPIAPYCVQQVDADWFCELPYTSGVGIAVVREDAEAPTVAGVYVRTPLLLKIAAKGSRERL